MLRIYIIAEFIRWCVGFRVSDLLRLYVGFSQLNRAVLQCFKDFVSGCLTGLTGSAASRVFSGFRVRQRPAQWRRR